MTFKLGKSRQQINLVSQGYGRRRQDETLARKRVGVGGLIYTGQRRPFWELSDTGAATWLKWGNSISGRGNWEEFGQLYGQCKGEGHCQVYVWWTRTPSLWKWGEGEGKPVLYVWPGNNPLLPLGALPLGGQVWVLLSVAFLGWRQSIPTYLHRPDFCEQSRKMWFRILLTLKVVLEGDYNILKGCWIVRGGEGSF